MLGLILGGLLGLADGLNGLRSPAGTGANIFPILAGSMVRGLLAGVTIGFVARRVNNLFVGIVVGLLVGVLLAVTVARLQYPDATRIYFWEDVLPGSVVGLIVGFATQRYGRRTNSGGSTNPSVGTSR